MTSDGGAPPRNVKLFLAVECRSEKAVSGHAAVLSKKTHQHRMSGVEGGSWAEVRRRNAFPFAVGAALFSVHALM